MVSGNIFNIQRYSIHDGPGIRTTVFLKGCPLRCEWCHNPESQSSKEEIIFFIKKCIRCGSCIEGCPEESITFIDHKLVLDKRKCTLCANCANVCPTNAIEMIGKVMSADQVLWEVEKDRIFFEQSGGGVTFSGGEPLQQFDFLKDLLSLCREKGIHTALDTSGYSSLEKILDILNYVNLFLYDIKFIDDQRHIDFTGVSNKLILDNLRGIAETGATIWIRLPIVPGVNDDDENILGIGNFIKSLNIKDISILPYHNTAIGKYEAFGKSYNLVNLKVPSEAHMKGIEKKLREFGLNVKIGG